MTFLKWLLVAVSLAAPAAAQNVPPANSAPPRTYNVAGNIHVAVLEDRNTTVVTGDDAVLIIETNYRERGETLKALVGTISPKPVKIAINSHWHGDHVGGNATFAAAGAVTIAHEKTRLAMSQGEANQRFPPEFWPMLTFKDSLTLHFGGHDVELTYYPDGHTDSDIAVRFADANVIYVGGLMNYPIYAGIRSPNAFVAALDKLLAQADGATKIIPWRGPLVGKAELMEWRNVLATVRDRVQAGIRDGKTVDEIIASQPSREFDAKWAAGAQPANFVRQVYTGLMQFR